MNFLKIAENTSLKIAPEEELERAFTNGDIVVCCWEPGCTMHRLPHWSEEKWVARKQQVGYRLYSHGICRWHFRAYAEEIDRYIVKNGTAAVAGS
jgi:hypothetical protein